MCVDRRVIRITLGSDPGAGGRLIKRVGAYPAAVISCVGGNLCEHQTVPVRPAFSHATALLGIQGSGI